MIFIDKLPGKPKAKAPVQNVPGYRILAHYFINSFCGILKLSLLLFIFILPHTTCIIH